MGYLETIEPYYFKSGLDPDAQAFLDATAITDGTITTAINQFVIDLKDAGIWTKLKALYPFVGGTATTHKYNLKDPRDLDIAFRLAFNGGWTHDSNGVTPNGSSGYANTFLNSRNSIAQYKIACGMYNRLNVSSGGRFAYGANDAVSLLSYLFGFNYYYNCGQSPDIAASGRFDRLIMMRRESNVLIQAYRDGVSLGTNTTVTAKQNPNKEVYYGALNNNGTAGAFDDHSSSLFFIGEDFTDQNAIDFNTAVNAFQITLGRAV